MRRISKVLFVLLACFAAVPPALAKPELRLTLAQAQRLAALPMSCIETQYPNKLQQVLRDDADLLSPQALHPAFYGCFDWHSSVHGHWTLVALLSQFPNLDGADKAKAMLANSLSAQNINAELAYFKAKGNTSFERTYGWAWLLKLSQALLAWDDPLAKQLSNNLKPLTSHLRDAYFDFLPKLSYPIRVGEHSNTAFGLAFAYDYAKATKDQEFINLVTTHAQRFYADDRDCPIQWEPSGFDFLSPCLEEVSLMRKVLKPVAFDQWLAGFLPQLLDSSFVLQPGEIRDRSDGKLVHLDGLNFSRAWTLYSLAKGRENTTHLVQLADRHVEYSLGNIVDEHYSGTHWLGSFALYALQAKQ